MPDSVIFKRLSPTVANITFGNAPVGLVVGEMVERLAVILDELASDANLRVLVFDSNVPDFFLNHFDLAHLDSFPQLDEALGVPTWTQITMRLSHAPFVTVGRIRGRTRGGGNELALALDLRYASREKALFGQPEVGTAIVPGGGGTERLPRAIGRDRALEVILTADDYDATTAERWGWVTRAFPDAELDSYVDAVVARLATFDRVALATAKRMVNRATLPPEKDLIAAYREFMHMTTLPAYKSVATAQAPTGEEGLRVEYHLGDFLGLAARRRAESATWPENGPHSR